MHKLSNQESDGNNCSINTKVGSLGHKIAGVLIIIVGSLLSFMFLLAFTANPNWAILYFALLFAGLIYYGIKVKNRPKNYEYSGSKFGKGTLVVVVSILLGLFINSQWKSYALEQEDKEWKENLKEYVKDTTIPSIDCLAWDLKTHESDIVQSNWAKTMIPGGITSYVDSYSDQDIRIQHQFTFVDGRLGQVSITLFNITQTPDVVWEMLLEPVYKRFGESIIFQGPTTYNWILPERNMSIMSGYKDGYGAWITVMSRDSNINRPILGAIGGGLQLIY